MATPLRIRGHLTGWTGYGQIAEWLGRGLEERGHTIEYEDYGADLRWLPQQDFVRDRLTSDPLRGWVVHVACPNHPFEFNEPTIHFTMWETTGLPRGGRETLNGARVVVVPNEFNFHSFMDGGVTSPIRLCPLGIAADEGYVHDVPIPSDGPTVFGMAGRISHGGSRKGLNEGIWAFLDAFPDDPSVRLKVKVWPDDLEYLSQPRDPRVEIDTTPMLPAQMARWYKGITCLFVPSRGEGWGLHTHQAMACGRPVIACKYSGTAEFFDGRFGWELQFDELPADGFYRGSGRWAVPSHREMVDCLQLVHYSRAECIRRGQAAAVQAARFTWERTAERFEQILEEAGALRRLGSAV